MTDTITQSWIRNAADVAAVENGCFFSGKQAAYVVWWIERYAKLYEGEWAGEPMRLRGCAECPQTWTDPEGDDFWSDPEQQEIALARAEQYAKCVAAGHRLDWQYECTMRLFGWQKFSARWNRNIRRFRKASIWIAKKNKKSPTLSGWGLYLLCGDGEQGQKVFFGAKDGSQARDITGKHAVEMVQKSEDLSRICTINKNLMRITHDETSSFAQPMSSANERNQKAKEGINGSILIDEVHVVDREFVERIERAGISRSEPLHIEVSTSGDDPDSYGKERFDYALQVDCGGILNEALFVAIHAAPQNVSDAEIEADPIKYGQMANPAWGHTVGEEEFLADFNDSKQSAGRFAKFKMYRLNIWQQSANPWLRMDDWDACRSDFTADSLKGSFCVAGMDLALTQDMCSFALVFPQWDENGLSSAKVLPYFFLPEAYANEHRDSAQFLHWSRMQWDGEPALYLTPGNVADTGFIFRKFSEACQRYKLQKLGYDQRFAEHLTQMIAEGMVDPQGKMILEGLGVERLSVSQSRAVLTEPIELMERLVLTRRFHHNGHPVFNWQARNVTCKEYPDGTKRLMKPTPDDTKKIDGIMASVFGLSLAMTTKPYRSVYESRGILSV